ncbi:hypothetical protein CKO14_07775 [Halorhodospira halophila]|nr:hypothetical protein [Halorhodospira halophila]
MLGAAAWPHVAALGVFALWMVGCEAWQGLSEEEYLERAAEQLEAGEYRAAVLDYRNALQKVETPETRGQLGLAYAGDGDTDAAINHLTRALEQGAEPKRYAPTLARLYHETRQHGELVDFEYEALEGEAKARVFAYRAVAAYHRGDDEAGSELLTAAVSEAADLPELELAKAFGALVAGDRAQAASHLEAAVALDEDYYPAWTLRGSLAEVVGERQSAREAFDRAVDLRPDYVSDRFSRAMVRLREEDFEGARADAEQLVEGAPGFAGGYFLMGLVELEGDSPDEARTQFEEALARQREYRPARPYLAGLELERGNLAQAEHHLNRYHASGPGSVTSYTLRARLYMAQDQPEEAREVLSEALAERPEWVSELGDRLGALYLDTGDVESGIQTLRRVLDAQPDALETREVLGTALLLAGDEEKGLEELEAVASADGALRAADLTLVQAYIEAGRFEAAAVAAERTQDKAPEDPVGYNLRAAVLLGQGDRPGARRVLREGLEAVPDSADLAMNLSSLERARGEAEAGIEVLRGVHQAVPDEPRVAMRLAEWLIQMDSAAEGLSVLEQTLEERPEDAQFLGEAARIYGMAGEDREARRLLERATELDPDAADLHYLLALARAAAGDEQGSVEALESALSADPSHYSAAHARSRQLARQGQREEAEEVFAPVAEANPDAPEVHAHQGWLAYRDGRFARAAEHYGHALSGRMERSWVLEGYTAKRAADDLDAGIDRLNDWLSANPADAQMRHVLGSALLEAGRDEDAIQVYTHLLQQREQDPLALNNLAWLLREDAPDQALEYARRAYDLAPGEAAVLDTLGVVLLRNDRTSDAVEYLDQAVALAGGDPDVQLNLARALRADGQVSQARDILEQLLEAHADFSGRQDAEEMLTNLGD